MKKAILGKKIGMTQIFVLAVQKQSEMRVLTTQNLR